MEKTTTTSEIFQMNLTTRLNEATQLIRARSQVSPRIGLILGSGLGGVADALKDAMRIFYSEVPGFAPANVAGHAGRLVLGDWNGVPCAVLEGRYHFYEGHSMASVAFPARVLCALGVESLVLTNAAGSVNPDFAAGDVMAISDHLNLMGDNPLRGDNDETVGPRFPDMTNAYDANARQLLHDAAQEAGFSLREGVYAGLSGPVYETPAEVRMLRVLGADAVGMSTVPECIVARHMGVRVAGLSCITNLGAGLSAEPLSHGEVMAASRENAAKVTQILERVVGRL